MFHTRTPAGSPYDHQESIRRPANPENTHYDCQRLGDLLVAGQARVSSAPAGAASVRSVLRSDYPRPHPTSEQSSFFIGHLHRQRHGVSAARVSAGRRRHFLVVFDDGRDARRPAGGHLARFHEEDRRVLAVHDPPPVLSFGLHVRHPVAVPPPDVEIDAEVEEGHRDEGREELEGGSRQQEVPGAVELGETLVLRNDALADQQLPEDDGGTVEEERQDPDCQHLEYCQTRDALLSSIPHLVNKA